MSTESTLRQLITAPLRQTAQALQSGEVSSIALTEQCLREARRSDGEGSRVFTRLLEEQALASAQASDVLLRAGLPRSLLEGVVIAVKDLFDVAGLTTMAGSIAMRGEAPAKKDAVIVNRLRQAGAVIIGLTNMTEFAFSGLGLNPHYGTPRNPWDRQTGRIPGGSSSGSAVAVTDAMTCAAIGTDTGGSVRIPSALCGLTGFKPTARRIDQTGTLPLSTSLDSIGPLARTVDCCALLDAVMVGHLDRPPVRPASVETMVLGLPRQLFMDGMDDEVAHAFSRARERLEKAGARIVDLDMPEIQELPHINRAGGLSPAEAWAWHEDLLERKANDYDPRVMARIRRGATQSARDYIEIVRARADWIRRVNERLEQVDALIAPTVPRIAPEVAMLEKDDDLYVSTNMLMLRNPSVINFLDGCAVSLPCHQPGQAPVGLMLACSGDRDERLLSLAKACEAVLSGGHSR